MYRSLAPRTLTRSAHPWHAYRVFSATVPRRLSTSPSPEPSAPPPRPSLLSHWRISTMFGVLILGGIGATVAGIYEFVNAFPTWPPEVRADLRSGMTCRRREDWVQARGFLNRCWTTALSLPLSAFAPDAYLKLSGIAIVLGDVIERLHDPADAAAVYRAALDARTSAPSPRERMRTVALASRLAHLEHGAPDEEKWLTRAVEELLQVLLEVKRDPQRSLWDALSLSGPAPKPSSQEKAPKNGEDPELVLAELSLPSWVTKTDIGAPLEALGTFYATHDKIEYAYPLYLHAAALLIGPVARSPAGRITGVASSTPLRERCRGAQLLANTADLALRYDRGRMSGAALAHARDTTADAVAIMEEAVRESKSLLGKVTGKGREGECEECETGLVAAFFNMGVLAEMSGDTPAARASFESALTQAKELHMPEGVREASTALRRVERQERADAILEARTQRKAA